MVQHHSLNDLSMRLSVLGSVELSRPDGRDARAVLAQPKRLALLAYLALAKAEGFVRRDKVLAVFWPELDEPSARKALRQSVYFLKRQLGPDVIESTREEVRIAPGSLVVDAHDFEAAVERRDALVAMALWRGSLLDGIFVRGAPAFERWLDHESTRLRDLAWNCFSEGAARSRQEGRLDHAGALARAACAVRPLHQASTRLLMQIQLEAGEGPAALGTYARLVESLDAAAFGPPDQETQGLAEAIRGEGSPDPGEAEAAAAPRADDTLSDVTSKRPPPSWLHEPSPPARRTLWQRWAPTLGRVGGALLVISLAFVPATTPTSLPLGIPTPGVAVLPLENLSQDPADATLTAGLHGQLVHMLGRSTGEGMRVIARQSVLPYRDQPVSLEAVGRALDVGYIVSGSVLVVRGQAEGDQLQVMVELIEVSTGQELWSAVYDDVLTPQAILDIQAGIIEQVAGELVVAIRNEEIYRAGRVGTTDGLAYELYLRSLALENGAAVPLLAEAVSRAPDFLLANARLAEEYAAQYQYADRSNDLAARAELYARRALELDPTSPDAALAMAWVRYRTKDWSGAQTWMSRVRGSLRGDHQYLVLQGYVARRLHRWDTAVESLTEAVRIDPRSPALRSQLAATLAALRRYDEAIPLYESDGHRPEKLARARWYSTGDISHLEGSGSVDLDFLRWDAATYREDWPEALAILDRLPPVRLHRGSQWLPLELLEAWVRERMGEEESARSLFVQAEAQARSRLARMPDDARAMSALALAHSGLGSHKEAIREAEAAVDMAPMANDVVEGPHHMFHLAGVYARAGEVEAAVEKLDAMLSQPTIYHVLRVEHDPLMRPIRDTESFRALMEKHRTNAF